MRAPSVAVLIGVALTTVASPTRSFSQLSQTDLAVSLLQQSHDVASLFRTDLRAMYLQRQAAMAETLNPALARELADELFALSFEQKGTGVFVSQEEAVGILSRIDPLQMAGRTPSPAQPRQPSTPSRWGLKGK